MTFLKLDVLTFLQALGKWQPLMCKPYFLISDLRTICDLEMVPEANSLQESFAESITQCLTWFIHCGKVMSGLSAPRSWTA